MSVIGELTRHLDGLLAELDGAEGPRASAVGNALRATRPHDPEQLSDAAERILAILAESGLASDGPGPAPEAFSPSAREAAQTVAALSRIVLGR